MCLNSTSTDTRYKYSETNILNDILENIFDNTQYNIPMYYLYFNCVHYFFIFHIVGNN